MASGPTRADVINQTDFPDHQPIEDPLVVPAPGSTNFPGALSQQPLVPATVVLDMNGQIFRKQGVGPGNDFTLSGSTNQDLTWLNPQGLILEPSDIIHIVYVPAK